MVLIVNQHYLYPIGFVPQHFPATQESFASFHHPGKTLIPRFQAQRQVTLLSQVLQPVLLQPLSPHFSGLSELDQSLVEHSQSLPHTTSLDQLMILSPVLIKAHTADNGSLVLLVLLILGQPL